MDDTPTAQPTSHGGGESNSVSRVGTSQKLRSACDACHRAKVRCSGEPTCSRCLKDGVECRYSYRAHFGKPKGSLNKKTVERLRAMGREPPPREPRSKPEKEPTGHRRLGKKPTPELPQAELGDGGQPSFEAFSVFRTQRSPTPPRRQGSHPTSTSVSASASTSTSTSASTSTCTPTPTSTPILISASAPSSIVVTTSPGLDLSMMDSVDFDRLMGGADDIAISLFHTDIRTPRFHMSSPIHSDSQTAVEEAFPGVTDTMGSGLGSFHHGSPTSMLSESLAMMEEAIMSSSCGATTATTAATAKTATTAISPPISHTCGCVRALTAQVQHLHEASRTRSAVGLDKLLRCTQQTTCCVSTVVQCHSCAFDVQTFLLAAVALSLTLDLILPVMDLMMHHHQQGQCSGSAGQQQQQQQQQQFLRPQIEIRVGDLDVSGQLGEALQKFVVRANVASLKVAVEKFEVKVDFVSGDSTQVDFLRHETKRLKKGLEKIVDVTGPADSGLMAAFMGS